MEDIEQLRTLSQAMRKASLCGLGQTAPNPILSTLNYFEEEYLAHIRDRKCPAGKCKELISYTIIAEKCVGCTACARVCPVHCISGEVKGIHVIDQSQCIKCGQCFEKCRFDAILKG
jgi:ferredoxin